MYDASSRVFLGSHYIAFGSTVNTCSRQLTRLWGTRVLTCPLLCRDSLGPDSTENCGSSTGPVLGQVVVDVPVVVQRQVSTLTVEMPQLHRLSLWTFPVQQRQVRTGAVLGSFSPR